MKCISATRSEIQCILDVLNEAKKVRNSENFLCGFPDESTKWFMCELKVTFLGDLYLFWDGKAWEEPEKKTPRRVKQGVKDFKRIKIDSKPTNTNHLNKIIKLKKKIESSNFQNLEPFPILVGLNKGSPILILDGNHRLAALWWATPKRSRSKLDIKFWVGFSLDMKRYKYYARIL